MNIEGTSSARIIMEQQKILLQIFTIVIEPVISEATDSSGKLLKKYFCKEGTSLKDSFLYAFSLLYSRSHGRGVDIGTVHPLVCTILSDSLFRLEELLLSILFPLTKILKISPQQKYFQ